jgi:hypothetical protein
MPTSDQLRAWRLRADLIDLAVTRDDAEATFEELRRDKHQNPVILERAQLAAGEAQASLDDALGELADLASKDRPPSEPNPLGQPRYILDLEFANPDPQAGFDPAHVAWGGDSQTALIGGAFLSVDAKIEWKQVAPPHDTDFEDANLVGAAGWALAVEYSHADVPFDHPFGFDWEFMFALDPDYTFLLSSANDVDEVEIARAVAQAGPRRIPAPLGPLGFSLLGVETDAGLVPKQFRDPLYGGVFDGDRVAVVGRWIVDCGHEVTLGDQSASYRTEIHPPLLIADGFVTNVGLAERTLDRPRTRVHFASRPYLVGQHFCVDPAHAYEDETDDDGTMWDHMVSELVKVASIQSFQVEGHPRSSRCRFAAGRRRASSSARPRRKTRSSTRASCGRPGSSPSAPAAASRWAPVPRAASSLLSRWTIRPTCRRGCHHATSAPTPATSWTPFHPVRAGNCSRPRSWPRCCRFPRSRQPLC